jgi:hypothetical protein
MKNSITPVERRAKIAEELIFSTSSRIVLGRKYKFFQI